MQSCKFCGAPIDPATAAAPAALQERVKKACDWAGSTRNFAVAMPAFFLLSFVSFVPVEIGMIGRALEEITLLGIPFVVIGWRQRFGKLESPDPDLARARRAVAVAARVWVAMVIVNVLWFLYRRYLVGDTR